MHPSFYTVRVRSFLGRDWDTISRNCLFIVLDHGSIGIKLVDVLPFIVRVWNHLHVYIKSSRESHLLRQHFRTGIHSFLVIVKNRGASPHEVSFLKANVLPYPFLNYCVVNFKALPVLKINAIDGSSHSVATGKKPIKKPIYDYFIFLMSW
jgi:hypothetical protein